MSASPLHQPTGYGPSHRNNLIFSGQEADYDLWEVRMLGYMAIKGMKTTILTPPAETPDVAENEKAYSELVLLLDSSSLSMVMTDAADDGREALRILRAHYRGTSKPRILTLYTNLCNLKYIPDSQGLSLTDYISRAERLVLGLKAAGETISDSLLIAMAMKGLPPSFDSFIVFITQSGKEYSFVEFKAAIRDYSENERSRSSNALQYEHHINKDNVMTAKQMQPGRRKATPKCYACKKDGHFARSCPNIYCTFCKINGHTLEKCRKKESSRSEDKVDTAKVATESGDADSHTYALCARSSNSNHQGLLVDTGATSHIVSDHSKFTDFQSDFRPSKHYIELADGSKSCAALKRGTAYVSIKDADGRLFPVRLQNTLYVPSYKTNIFSVNAAVRNGASMTFGPSCSFMTTGDGRRFDFIRDDKLYYLPAPLSSSVDKCDTDRVSVNKERTMKQLHSIMGHCNQDDLQKLEGVVDGLKISDRDSKFFCDICCRGKLPHSTVCKKPDARARKPLDLVHSDLSGAVEPVAKDGHKYCICFVDDFSGMMFHYFLKHKSDTTRATARFIADMAHIGSIKRLRTDNGGEYVGADFKDLLIQHSIKHEFSSPNTPQQNGTAERSWRTTFDMVRCMLLDSNLPKNLWPYALATSGYTRNRCYQNRTDSTPYELFTGRRPNLSGMAAFGSKVFVLVEKRRKLDDRSVEGVFVGYDRDSPAYLIYDRNTGAVKKSRNVKFDHAATSVLSDPMHEIVIVNRNDQVDNIVQGQNEIENNTEQDIENAQHIENNENDENSIVDRPIRNVKMPKYLSDNYVVDFDTDDCNDSDSSDVCYRMYNADVPKSYDEAMTSPEANNWQEAMQSEYDSLSENNTWDITDLPEGKRIIGGKWVFNKKFDKDNDLTKYKARYVARGFSQIEGVDYTETFSPTARLNSVRMLMQVAVQHDLLLHQMDVKTAYLNADIDHEIYLMQPQGFEKEKNKVCLLNKSLYGLKQSGKLWNKTVHDFFTENDFVRSEIDHCIYMKKCSEYIVYILIWVDDIIIAASNEEILSDTKSKLNTRFNMVDLGTLSWFLGIEFIITKGCIEMNQTRYLQGVLDRFNMANCKSVCTPCDKLIIDPNADKISLTEYKCAIGSLIYAMVCTRPDLSYTVTKLAQYNEPNKDNWIAVKRVLRYIKGTITKGLKFTKCNDSKLSLVGYSDASWASDLESRRSVTGFCFTLNKTGGAISWKSKRQPIVSLSSTEAEYIALAAATQEALYLKRLMKDMVPDHDQDVPVTIFEDNQGAIALAKNPVHHNRTKHIDVRFHFIREQIVSNCIHVEYLQTNKMIADSLTKAVGKLKLEFCNKVLFGSTRYNIEAKV